MHKYTYTHLDVAYDNISQAGYTYIEACIYVKWLTWTMGWKEMREPVTWKDCLKA